MDVLIFLFFSALEWFALFVLTFAMFKIWFRGNWGQLMYASLLMSLVSYLVFLEYELHHYSPLIQLPSAFLFLWLFFNVHVFYAGLMVVNGFMAYGLIQSVLVFLFELSGTVPSIGEPLAYLVQLMSALLAFAVAWRIHRENRGFSFVPDASRRKLRWKPLHFRLLLVTLLGLAGAVSFNYMYYSAHASALILIFSSLIFGLLQYFSVQWEYANT